MTNPVNYPGSLQQENAVGQSIVKNIISDLGEPVKQALKQGGLTKNQMDSNVEQLRQMALKAEQLFGASPNLSDENVQEFLRTQFLAFIPTIAETMRNQPPDLIREAGLSEAVFSHKGDYHPIVVTNYLASCIGVAGYDPVHEFGFVVHFTCEKEVIASGSMLLDRILAYRKQDREVPLMIHLRGGVKNMSEPLLERVKEWLCSTGLKVVIASENTLKPGTSYGTGSIKLDIRNGTCEEYDPRTNPYSQEISRDMRGMDSDEALDLLVQVATKKSEIKIVYDSRL